MTRFNIGTWQRKHPRAAAAARRKAARTRSRNARSGTTKHSSRSKHSKRSTAKSESLEGVIKTIQDMGGHVTF